MTCKNDNKLIYLLMLTVTLLMCRVSVFGADYSDWRLITGNAQFEDRDKFVAVTQAAKVWVLGGTTNDETDYNDAWYSYGGSDWVAATRNAAWSARNHHMGVGYDGKIWVMSGEPAGISTFPNDVWYSTDGADWTAATKNAEFLGREGGTSIVFDNKMYIIGGRINRLAPDMANDVWYSTDGVEWTAATRNAEWSARMNMAVTSFDGKLWVLGGTTIVGGIYYNDAWYSSDGVEWIAATRNAEWAATDALIATEEDGKLCVYLQSANEAWTSLDGVSWTKATNRGTQPAGRRDSAFTEVFGNLVMFGGYVGELNNSEVWLNGLVAQTSTVTPTYTQTTYITRTITPSRTPTFTPTFTRTITQTVTLTPTRTQTTVYTAYPTQTFTPSVSPTYTESCTYTPTNTPIVTRTITETMTFSPTLTESATVTPTHTNSPTITVSPTSTTVTGEFLNQLSVRSDGTKSSVLLEWRQYPSDNKYYLTHGEFTEEITIDKDLAPLDKTRFIYELTVDGDASGLSVSIKAVGIDVYTGIATAVATVQAMPTPDLTPRHIFNIDTVNQVLTPGVAYSYLMNAQATPQYVTKYADHIGVTSQDYLKAISEGDIPGHSSFGKNGVNSDVGTSWETVWGASTNYVFPTSAMQMEVVSSNNVADFFLGGTGAKQVYIKYLKADYTEATEYINLSGTTAVSTVATDIYRINNFRVNSVGSGGGNVGNLTIRGIGGGATYGYIPVGENRAQSSIYTVPKDYTLYITGIGFSSVGNKIMRFTSEATYDTVLGVTTTAGTLFYPYTTVATFNSPYYQTLDTPTRFPQYTDLRIQVVADSAGSEATAQYKGWLER